MISASYDHRRQYRFEIRPNRSMSWAAAKVLYLGMVCFSLSIAVGLAVLGFWPVLPFAGAELLGLGCALYLSAVDAERCEVVSIGEDTVEVEKGGKRRERTWKFVRAWTRLRLCPPPVNWYPSRLLLCSHGREVELGGFLNEQERRRLAGDLRRVL